MTDQIQFSGVRNFKFNCCLYKVIKNYYGLMSVNRTKCNNNKTDLEYAMKYFI